MRSKDILKQALEDYAGTMILVSHDRQFLDGLVETVYEFKDHKIKKYIGGISDFLEKKKIDSLRQLEIKQEVFSNYTDRVANSKTVSVSGGKEGYFGKKEFHKQLRRLAKKISECEESIERLEKQVSEMDEMFASESNNYADPESQKIFTHYARHKEELGNRMKEWEHLQTELTGLKNNNLEYLD